MAKLPKHERESAPRSAGKRPVGRPKPGASEQLTAYIIEVAMTMFLQKGFANTTVDAIIAKCKTSKVTFYSRFRSKEDLLEACIGDFNRRAFPQRLDDSLMKLPLPERLILLGDHILGLLLHPETIAFERLAVAESYRFPQIASIGNEFGTKRAIAVIKDFFDDAIAREDIRPVDTILLSQLYMDILFGFLRRAVQGLGQKKKDESMMMTLKDINETLLSGLRMN